MNKNTAVALPILDDNAITKALRQSGAIEESMGGARIRVDGSMFIAGEDMYPYNPAKKEPAFVGRLVGPMVEYQALWFDADHAKYANRPDIQDKYCKSYFNEPTQNRKFSQDGTECAECPFHPFVKDPVFGKKCQWRGDLELQIVPESGKLEGNEPIWTLSFPTTSVIEFKGTKRDPVRGNVSQFNFMHKLARFASSQAATKGEDQGQAILRAIESYHNGGVVAEFRLLGNTSDDNARTWRVISLEPVYILDVQAAPAIEAGTDSSDYGDLPF